MAKELVNEDLQETDVQALDYLAQAYATMSQFVDTLMVCHSPIVTLQCVQLSVTDAVGRPSFDIPCDQLQYLIDNRFSVPQIAQLLGVSVSTVRRRMSLYNLSICATYSPMTDVQLDELVANVQP